MSQRARDGGVPMAWKGGIARRARKALRLCSWLRATAQRTRAAACLCIILSTHPAYLVAATEKDNQTDFQPFDTRDQNLFNLIHGQALPTNARLNKKSQALWSNSLVITNALIIQSNSDESIYLDYEAYRYNLSYQYGLNDRWNLKLDVPLIYQSGGIFDSAIDNWHEFWGLPLGNRPNVEHDQYNIQYAYQSQTLIDLSEGSTSLGDIQLALARTLIESRRTTMSLWASLKLPTGDEDKLSSNGAIDASAWLALNQRVADDWVINMNAGAVVLGADDYKNIPLSDYALYGNVMLGWSLSDNINLKLQLQGHTSYYDNSQLTILGDTYFLTFGGTISINQCNQLDIAMSEDIKVDASPDASLIISWRSYTSQC